MSKEKNMKLCFIIVNLEKGGAQRVMLNLCHSLAQDHTIDILTLRDSEIGYPLHSLNTRMLKGSKIKNRFLRFFIQRNEFKNIIKDNTYDGIISFLPEANFMITSFKTNAFKIINVRNDPKVEYKGIYHALMKVFYPKAECCVVQTNVIKNYFSPYLSKISVIPNPVSDILYQPTIRKPIVLNVGRLVPQKNQALLIQAFSEFHKEHPNYQCHIIGQGPLKADLQRLIHELKCDDCIQLFEPTDQIFKIMQEAELFVLSSDYEGYPNVLLEAMACGCACIATDCDSGGPREIIEHGENGLLIPINNKTQLIQALNQYMNPEFRQTIQQSAREIQQSHSYSHFYKAYKQIIESCGKDYVKS